MAISLDEYDKINSQMPKRGKGDEIELSQEDEAALNATWDNLAKEKASKNKSAAVA